MADNAIGFARVIRPNTTGSFKVADKILDRMSDQDLDDLVDLILELSESYNLTIGTDVVMDGLLIWWRPAG